MDVAPHSSLALSVPDELLDELVERIAARVAEQIRDSGGQDRWMDSREAAHYIGRSRSTMQKLMAQRALPFEQSKPGARGYFRKSDLDAWMQS